MNETTGLLKKAYDSSGSLPLAASYEDVRESIELQLQRTATATTTKEYSTTDGASSWFRRRHAIGMLLGGCALCVSLIMLFLWHPQRERRHSGHEPAVPDYRDYSAPFSHLDPVHDLGLPEHVRAKAVSPDWKYLDASFKSPEDHRNAVPTNAWYQNLLMANGEPSNLQRVYPVPYLVDLVGMIPGLRAHVTHIEANDMVMQLSFNENFGLVLGATKSIQSAADNDASKKRGVDENEKWTNHQYKVTSATNLGVTLEWVSKVFLEDAFWIRTNAYLNSFDLNDTGCVENVVQHCERNAFCHDGIRQEQYLDSQRSTHPSNDCIST